MTFDIRKDSSPEKKEAFVAWLTQETTSTFQRAAGDPESLKTFVFLAVNRAHESGILSSETAKIVGTSIARAGLSPKEEDIVLGWLEFLDPIATTAHTHHASSKPWWKFWL